MNRPIAKTFIAAALVAAFGSAMAGDDIALPSIERPISGSYSVVEGPDRSDSVTISRSRTTTHSVANLDLSGDIRVKGEASANANSIQQTTDNVSANMENSPNTATLRSGAADMSGGNIGINITAGAGNLQGNSAAIVSSNASDVFASASTYAQQLTMTNFALNLDNSTNSATMEAALQGATGNVGLNISAGAGHAQSNQLAMLDASGTKVVRAATSIEQASAGNMSAARSEWKSKDSANTASVHGGALLGSTGNIGLNVTAGSGNAQANALSVAVASSIAPR